jgi:hypothetical protein
MQIVFLTQSYWTSVHLNRRPEGRGPAIGTPTSYRGPEGRGPAIGTPTSYRGPETCPEVFMFPLSLSRQTLWQYLKFGHDRFRAHPVPIHYSVTTPYECELLTASVYLRSQATCIETGGVWSCVRRAALQWVPCRAVQPGAAGRGTRDPHMWRREGVGSWRNSPDQYVTGHIIVVQKTSANRGLSYPIPLNVKEGRWEVERTNEKPPIRQPW